MPTPSNSGPPAIAARPDSCTPRTIQPSPCSSGPGQSLVDPILTPSRVDRLLGDVQVVRHLRDAATLLKQVEDLAAKLRADNPKLITTGLTLRSLIS